MKLIKLALEKSDTYELNGTLMKVYHRTDKETTADSICNLGFIPGGGAMYGKGIYSTFTLKSSLRDDPAHTYGPLVLMSEMDISNFLIFDYDIAKQVYGDNYRLIDQVKVIGEDKFLDPSRDKGKQLRTLELASDDLEQVTYSSDIACSESKSFQFDKIGLNGIIYTGATDGRCALAYKPTLITPIAHAWVDGKTYHNPNWTKCEGASQEELLKLRKDEVAGENFVQDRMRLLTTLKSFDKGRVIDVSNTQYPNIPKPIFDQTMAGYLYEDEARIERLSPELRDQYKDIIEVDFLIKKLKSAPTVYWKEYQALPQETRDKIPQETIIDIWSDFIGQYQGQWDQIPKEIRPYVDPTGEAKYWLKALQKERGKTLVNKTYWKFMPQEIFDFIRRNNKLIPKGLKPKSGEYKEIVKTRAAVPKKEQTEMVSEFEDIEINKSVEYWLKDKIDTLNRRAMSIGLPPIEMETIAEDRKTGMITVRLTGSMPVLKGWKLIARINRWHPEKALKSDDDPDAAATADAEDAEEVEPTVQDVSEMKRGTFPLSDSPIPPELDLDNVDFRCDHCTHNRFRTECFVLLNEGDDTDPKHPVGSYVIIGSSCLSKFIGFFGPTKPHDIAKYATTFKRMIASFKEDAKKVISEEQKSDKDQRAGHAKSGVPTEFFLGKILMLEKMGEGPKKRDPNNATALDRIGTKAWLWCAYPHHAETRNEVVKEEQLEMSATDITLIDNAVQWAKGLDSKDFDQLDWRSPFPPEVMKQIADIVQNIGHVIKKRGKGREASTVFALARLIPAYRYFVESKETNEYEKLLGEPGSSIFFQGKIASRRDMWLSIAQQGLKNVNGTHFVAEDDKDRKITWYGEAGASLTYGDPISLTGTIEDYTHLSDGESVTALKDVELITNEVFDANKDASEAQTAAFQDKYTPAYKDGITMEDDFTLSGTPYKEYTQGKYLCYLRDSNDIYFEAYTDEFPGSKGTITRLKGVVKRTSGDTTGDSKNERYLLQDAEIISAGANYEMGTVIEDDFTIIGHADWGKQYMYSLEDSKGKIFYDCVTYDKLGEDGATVKLKATIARSKRSAMRRPRITLTAIEWLDKPAAPDDGQGQTVQNRQVQTQYNEGDQIEEDLKITKIDLKKWRNNLYRFKDKNGKSLTAWLDRSNTDLAGKDIGDVVRIKGTISYKEDRRRRTWINIENLEVVDGQASQAQAPSAAFFQNGEVVEENFTIQKVTPTKARGNVDKYHLIDPQGRTCGLFSNQFLGNANDVLRIRGTIKEQGTWINLENWTILPTQPPTSQPPVQPATPPVTTPPPGQQPPAAPQAPQSPVPTDNGDAVTASSMSWLSLEDVTDCHRYSGVKGWYQKYVTAFAAPDTTLPVPGTTDGTDSVTTPQDGSDGPTYMTSDDIDVDKAYQTLSDSYNKATGTSWDENTFRNRIAGWNLYGDEEGWVAVRPQRSGLLKLTAVAGNPKSILKGFNVLMAENKPVWGMVSDDIKNMAIKKGLKTPPAGKWTTALLNFMLGTLKKTGILGNVDVQGVNADGGVLFDYPQLGQTTKYLIGNDTYFQFLKTQIAQGALGNMPATIAKGAVKVLSMMGF